MPDNDAGSSDVTPAMDPALASALNVAKVAKAQAEARSAVASAETTEAAARTATAKALIGDIPPAPYTGSVTTTEAAALAEHNKLAREALLDLADGIAEDVVERVGDNVFVTADDVGPSRAAAENFSLNSGLVRQALERAIKLSGQLDGSVTGDDDASDSLAAAAVIPLVLSGLNSFFSYARSDHTLSGRELQPGERTLVTAVAHGLLNAGKRVRLDGPPAPVAEAELEKLTDELAQLSSDASEARALAAHHASRIKDLSPKEAPPAAQASVADAASDVTDPDPTNQRPLHERALGSLNAAVKLYDELEASLLAAVDGRSGIARVAAARTLASFLDVEGGAILVVKLDGVFGSTLSTKNLLTTVMGEIPYKLSVQAQASWRCFDAKTSDLIVAGLKAKHIQFKKIDEIG